MDTQAENRTFLEFFAGGGMARLGLSASWKCLFANDIDPTKAACYSANFDGAPELVVGDIRDVAASMIPGAADLAWASFPCQDLSLAGSGKGLRGERSGMFWPFWSLIRALDSENRAPRVIVLENVYGAVTSHGGLDFVAIVEALAATGYRVGGLIIDAVRFVPQSRPRLFIVGVEKTMPIPAGILGDGPIPQWHPPSLLTAFFQLSREAAASWVWWQLPDPPTRSNDLAQIVEPQPSGIRWHTEGETSHLLKMMSPQNLEKIDRASSTGRLEVGALYRRTRRGSDGKSAQRAEVRFDGVAGCLRTPQGGSSRQTLVIVEGPRIRTRLLSPREAARLMGIPDSYILPNDYNAAYFVAGDGVVVPVVSFLARNILERLLSPAGHLLSLEAA